MQLPTVIETPRLILRPPTLADAPAIYESYARDPEVTRYMEWRPHESLADTEAFLHTARGAAGEELLWALTLKGDERVIGMIALHPAGFRVGIGYVLGAQTPIRRCSGDLTLARRFNAGCNKPTPPRRVSDG